MLDKFGIDLKKIDKKFIYLMIAIVVVIFGVKTFYLSSLNQQSISAKNDLDNSAKELLVTKQQINDYKVLGNSSVDDIATQLVQLEGFLPQDVDDLLFNQYLAQTASANKITFSPPNIVNTIKGTILDYRIYNFAVSGNYSDAYAFISSIMSHPQYFITVADTTVTFSTTNQFVSKVTINLNIRVWLSHEKNLIDNGKSSKNSGLATTGNKTNTAQNTNTR